MEASKWLEIQALLAPEEMETLFAHLNTSVGPIHIYRTGTVTPVGEGEVSQGTFLETYQTYANALKQGLMPQTDRTLFSSVLSLSPQMLTVMKIGEDRQLQKLVRPCVQLQNHSMGYSEEDGKFYSMVFGPESITWGLQFSYPQLFLDPVTKEICKVGETPDFPNTALFRHIQRWIRHNTIPTPMQTPRGSINLPVRLGKECLSWINHHPQFKNRFSIR